MRGDGNSGLLVNSSNGSFALIQNKVIAIAIVCVSTNAVHYSGGNHNGACFGVDELQSLVEILDLERISGGSIPFIQLDDLRSMGISYGEAIHLMNEMGDLMRKYPSRNQHQRVHPQVQHNHNGGYKANDGGIDLDDWLGRTIDKVPAPAPPKPQADWE